MAQCNVARNGVGGSDDSEWIVSTEDDDASGGIDIRLPADVEYNISLLGLYGIMFFSGTTGSSSASRTVSTSMPILKNSMLHITLKTDKTVKSWGVSEEYLLAPFYSGVFVGDNTIKYAAYKMTPNPNSGGYMLISIILND